MHCAACGRGVAVDSVTGKCWVCLGGDEKPKRPSKYGNKRTLGPAPFGGTRTYDSMLEADRASELDMMQKGGAIDCWEVQPPIVLAESIKYRADFIVHEKCGVAYYEDTKGMKCPRFRIVSQLWPKHGTIPLHILSRKRGRWERTIIEPESKALEVTTDGLDGDDE